MTQKVGDLSKFAMILQDVVFQMFVSVGKRSDVV